MGPPLLYQRPLTQRPRIKERFDPLMRSQLTRSDQVSSRHTTVQMWSP